MAASREQHRMLYKIAHAYYFDELTQQQIANRFRLSRPKVSRLLQEARAEGVVDIILVPPSGGLADLERELEQRYDLDEAVVVSVSNSRDLASVKRELGPAAAECLIRSLTGDEVVAVAWGMSILAMVDALPFKSMPDVTVVQSNGGLGPVDEREHSFELTRRVAQKLGARFRLLQAPGVVSTRAAAQVLKSDRQIADTLALAARADVAVVGLGLLRPDTLLLREGTILTEEDVETLEEAQAVGDVALRYLDADGVPIDLDINERTIGLTLEQVKKIPRVMGIAGGEEKLDIIRATLRGGILDVLVTDDCAARELLAH